MKIPAIRKLPSGNYFCQLKVGGQSTSITDTTYDKVYAKAVAYKSGLLKAKKAPVRVTVADAIDEYIESRTNILSPSTIRGYRQIRRCYFQLLMNKSVDAIKQIDLQRAVNADAAKVSGKTIRNAFALLRSSLNDKCEVNFDKIALPPKEEKEASVLSRDEMRRVYAAIDNPQFEVAFVLAIWLSLRRSEFLGLTWDCVGKDYILVKSSVVLNDKNEYIHKTLNKTAKSHRRIPCPPFIIAKINALPRTGDKVLNLNANYYLTLLHEACDKAGVKRVGIHSLRHTNATVMAYVGVTKKHSMERGGWSTPSVLEKVYEHVFDDERIEAAEKIDRFYEDALGIKNANKNSNKVKKFRISNKFLRHV